MVEVIAEAGKRGVVVESVEDTVGGSTAMGVGGVVKTEGMVEEGVGEEGVVRWEEGVWEGVDVE